MQKRLNSLILMVLALLTISSCKSQDHLATFIGLAKVDITSNMAKENCFLDMYVFSGSSYPLINIVETDDMKKIEYRRYDIILNDKEYQTTGYLHHYLIDFKYKPIYLTKLEFQAGESVREWSIGRYSSQKYESTTDTITTNIVAIKDQQDASKYDLNVLINNQDHRTFYLNHMGTLAKQVSHDIIISTFPTNQSRIPPDNVRVYQNMKLEFSSKYFQVESVLKLTFFTNLKDETVYASYYVSRLPSIATLQKEGIAIQSLDHVSFMS